MPSPFDVITDMTASAERRTASGPETDVAEAAAADGLTDLISLIAEQPLFDADLEAILDAGCRYFDLDVGIFIGSGEQGARFEVASGTCDRPLADIVDALDMVSPSSIQSEVAAIGHAAGADDRLRIFHRDMGFSSFLTCAVHAADHPVGRIWFGGRGPRARPFDQREQAVLRLTARWIATRLEMEEARTSGNEARRRWRESEERHRLLYEKTPAMMHSIDDRGRLASVSDTWLATMGYTRDEVLGRPSTDFLTPESRRYAQEVVLPAFMTSGHCSNIAYQFVTKNGDVRDILLSATSQTDDDGTFLRSLAVLVDVTEGRRIERRLASKTAALQRTHADLARFTQIASHDLQEPLRRLVTYCDVLKEDYGPELSEGATVMTGIVQSGGRRLRLMINGLLAYIRISEQLDDDVELVDMTAVLGHVVQELDGDIVSRGLKIDIGSVPSVWGRSPLLKVLVHHLIANVVDHGGETATTVTVSADDRDDVWCFAVTDDGVGVEARFADRIFEIFQQLHLRDERERSGAGLAISRLIVQRLGGDLWLDRSYRNGARFLFTLPKTKPAPADGTGIPRQAPSDIARQS